MLKTYLDKDVSYISILGEAVRCLVFLKIFCLFPLQKLYLGHEARSLAL